MTKAFFDLVSFRLEPLRYWSALYKMEVAGFGGEDLNEPLALLPTRIPHYCAVVRLVDLLRKKEYSLATFRELPRQRRVLCVSAKSQWWFSLVRCPLLVSSRSL